MSRRVWPIVVLLVLVGGACYFAAHLIADEVRTSRWQARYFHDWGQRLTYTIAPGASDRIRFPDAGPYDMRLGYARIPHYTELLEARGFVREHQARMSQAMLEYLDLGLYAPYREKTRAGLALLDCNDRNVSVQRFPERQYQDYREVPQVLANSLLFVENQGLLNPEYPTRNPALDWRRLSRAGVDQLFAIVDRERDTPGGSTLATQIEKYRHSPQGRTSSISEKLRQMGSASVRAYLDGRDTVRARERIVVDYLNTVPLSARNGRGEIHGIGDGMYYWYGEDFDEANRMLHEIESKPPTPREAQVFKQALSLIIAQRRPSYHLRRYDTNLEPLTDSYLRLLAGAGVISPRLRDAALAARLDKAPIPSLPPADPFVTRKAINQVRTDLSRLLGVSSRYDLDRLDLTVASTINTEAQRQITATLMKLRDKEGARELGLYGHNMLRDHDDPSKLAASFTLFERVGNASYLRVQADNIDQPFDLNSGARLNLGSTAKLRTLVTYLEILAELHDRYAGMTRAELQRVPVSPQDGLTRWTIDWLLKNPNGNRRAMLEAALERKYAGGAGEAFFTGGGLQTFTNFERSASVESLTVRRAFQHSVNLVFIRMMRDIVRYEVHRAHPDASELLADRDAPGRRKWLERFADEEGSQYLTGFYRKYNALDKNGRIALLLQRVKPIAVRVAVALRSADPTMDEATFARHLRAKLGTKLDDEDVFKLYDKYGKDKFSLNDRGYLSRIHPLELWLIDYLDDHSEADLKQVLEASADVRQEVYTWLFRTRSKAGQDNRIRILLERDAFERIGERWRRLGYPFDTLTPSYGSAVGASGDRPAALSELAGILLSGGLQPYTETVRWLDFAAGTPYETRFVLRPGQRKRLLPEDVAELARRSLLDVVEGGTARSAQGAFPADRGMALGGKTGTGDHRHMVFGRGGYVIASRAVSRSATFVFTIGERYFGTVTLHVRGPHAARYSFTSALSVRLLRGLAPTIVAMDPQAGPATLACTGG
ncbi:transglycosylase domain-containing protein [Cupriavidus sp. DB3]|uniref:transglycosylase domain-containing protein n=1 Tax=Cupriavidus sp. DB3 TaxID=2873259 RepID=UPI001CF44BC7|nr:transglycosylase domain-containing protein [Cupriavidus sp. DB3]